MAEKRYSEAELAEILRRASDAQATDIAPGSEVNGFTLAEVAKVASELGIDPRHVADAADQLILSDEKSFNLFKGPSQKSFDRTVDGTLDDATWEEIVAEVRLAFEGPGTVSEVGSGREWKGGSEFRSVHLSAVQRGSKIRYRLTIDQQGMMVVGWLLAFGVAVMSSVAAGIALGAAGLFPLAILGILLTLSIAIFAITNRIAANINSKYIDQADKCVDRLVDIAPTPTTLSANLQNTPFEPLIDTESQSQKS